MQSLRQYLKRRLVRFVQENHPPEIKEILRAEPAPWDLAAVQLNALYEHIRRFGYPQYLFGLLCSARTAAAVKAGAFTAIEFGVAGGNGLVAMERHAEEVERLSGVKVHVVGFDTGTGMPPRTEPRDSIFALPAGTYPMDEKKLRARLSRADLRIGDIAQTVGTFMGEKFPPLGFISHDTDLFTSTMSSFELLTMKCDRLLPRVTMYFDDLHGYPYSSVTGEAAAITAFNDRRIKDRQIGQVLGLQHRLGGRYRFTIWTESFFIGHAFDHPHYNASETPITPVSLDTSLRS